MQSSFSSVLSSFVLYFYFYCNSKSSFKSNLTSTSTSTLTSCCVLVAYESSSGNDGALHAVCNMHGCFGARLRVPENVQVRAKNIPSNTYSRLLDYYVIVLNFLFYSSNMISYFFIVVWFLPPLFSGIPTVLILSLPTHQSLLLSSISQLNDLSSLIPLPTLLSLLLSLSPPYLRSSSALHSFHQSTERLVIKQDCRIHVLHHSWWRVIRALPHGPPHRSATHLHRSVNQLINWSAIYSFSIALLWVWRCDTFISIHTFFPHYLHLSPLSQSSPVLLIFLLFLLLIFLFLLLIYLIFLLNLHLLSQRTVDSAPLKRMMTAPYGSLLCTLLCSKAGSCVNQSTRLFLLKVPSMTWSNPSSSFYFFFFFVIQQKHDMNRSMVWFRIENESFHKLHHSISMILSVYSSFCLLFFLNTFSITLFSFLTSPFFFFSYLLNSPFSSSADSKGRDLIIKRNAQFTFHKVCSRIFSTFEASSDAVLPLFIDESAQEVLQLTNLEQCRLGYSRKR